MLIYRLTSSLFLLAVLFSCSSQSIDDFREEGEAVTNSLIQEFKKIHTRSELIDAKPKLQNLFNDLVGIMIAAQDFRTKHPEAEAPQISKQGQIYSDQLRAEMNRVYSSIEGSREIVEKYQEPALHRLDAYAKRASRKKSRLPL